MVAQETTNRGGRLTTPLIRRDGKLQPAGWEEALDLVVARFGEIKSRYGGNAFGFFSCSKATNEVNFVAQKFMRTVLSSNNIDSCNRT
jgi:predicted molibdopterin-dependent oxidoreductase YjgC